MVVAIDGPAGTGKSTVANMLADGLEARDGKPFTYLNSGNLYRAITLGCIRRGIPVSDTEKVLEYAASAALDYLDGRVCLDGEAVDDLLHSDEIDKLVSPLSSIVPVRHVVNGIVRRIAAGLNAVVEGRDMTTVVFPGAEFRFYLDASAGERARRRFEQKVSALSREEIEAALTERDTMDRNKVEGSLRIAEGVFYLDTSYLTLRQVYDKLRERIQG
ncbi:MAG: (d)CMP kinase [Treponema sp.]|jgi:cytidylate kinase|nr:(d)CMP kinase [Treponema sp.]